KACAYSALPSAGGGFTRNCDGDVSANGLTLRQCGMLTKSKPGTKRYSPGACPSCNDWTKVTITIDPTVRLDAATGRALLTGTIKCTRDDVINLALELHQDQKVGKQVVDVHAAGTTQVACGTTVATWARKMILTDGATWRTGAARATANTYNTPQWVTPAGAA